MQVILQMDVPKLGNAGDVVDVRDGYGRNYLIAKKLALPANPKNLHQLEHNKKVIAAHEAKRQKEADAIASKLNGATITIMRSAGDEGKLFGAVTTRDISDALMKQGIKIDHRLVELASPIKEIGNFEVPVKVYRDLKATVKVWVTRE